MLQAAGGSVPTSPWELVANASLVTKIVLGLLASLSLLSWSIMFGVWVSLSRAARTAEKLQDEFDRVRSFEDASSLMRSAPPGALPRMFKRAMQFEADVRVANQQLRERATPTSHSPPSATMTGSQIETLHLVLDSEASDERDRVSRFLPWLATIGSVSPLIGLLGTVLGVIDAFVGIASKGSGNLSAVAPGVAEALIATAAALTVAIPATFGYNIFASRVNRLDGRMESFGAALIALLVREGRI